MKKNELKTRLIIAQGELEAELENENGCFDEIAQRIFSVALGSGLLQEESTDDIEIQLYKSVKIINCDEQEYIDGIYLSNANTEVHFTASSLDGSGIYCYYIEDIDRKYVIEVLKELIKMCDK